MMRDTARHHMLEWLSPADWVVVYDVPEEEEQDVLSRVLIARGLDTRVKREAFFHVSLDDIPDPFLFLDMEKACQILDAVLALNSPRILIFGDYDADGLTSAALLERWLRARGCTPDILIPDRFDDGFGLSVALAEEILIHRPDLVITVDTGTSSQDALALLRHNGVDIIVTDHHLPDEHFVRGDVPIINPSIPDETYPFKELSGAGVAYLLTLAADQFFGEISAIRPMLTVIASVGTVADVMPLIDVNRAIVRAGLAAFDEHAPAGLKALFNRVNSNLDKSITSRDIAFSIAPRLNAAGRMGDVRLALDLLLEDDPVRVVDLADQLSELNEMRRQVERDVFQEAFHDVMSRQGDEPLSVAVAWGEGWHGGVLGIVSARLAERLRVPAITLSEENGMLSGSARTFGNINLIDGIAHAGKYLETFGGHEGAAGLSLKTENFDLFRDAMIRYIESIPKKKRYLPIFADTSLDGDVIDRELVESFDALEPTGHGFERPLFVIPHMMIENIVRVGEGRHLRLKVRSLGEAKNSFDAILFYRGDDEPFYSVGDEIDLLGTPDFNVWRERRSIQLQCDDIRPSQKTGADDDRLQSLFPHLLVELPDENLTETLASFGLTSIKQDVFIALWQLMSSLAGEERIPIAFLPSRLAWLLTHRYNVEAGSLAVLFVLAIFSEVGIGELVADEDGGYIFRLLDTGGEKYKLTETSLWEKLDAQGVLLL
ncbi:MAG: single-stranded-DNA-specific exonuclease RecJ [Saccharofermentanales bacterium]|jgi:single-stranded-DNA-specific exonuclease